MIHVAHIVKTFQVSRRKSGFRAAAKALFAKQTERLRALDDISFDIAEGEMVGYIGPNGAGKSSTIKIMSGVLTPDSGECIINGRTPWKDRIAHVKEIGVVFGQRSQLWWDVPVMDSFELLRDIYSVPQAQYRQTTDELIALLDLDRLMTTPVRQLSLGQRMRCELAASLIHSPKILFLDEPTIGLDAVSKIAVRRFIQRLNTEKKTTVILTTHDMQDIEALTRRILLIGKGRILLDGDIAQLKRQHADQKTLTLDYQGALPAEVEGLTLLTALDGRAQYALNAQTLPLSQAIALLSSRVEIQDLSVSGPSIEDIVLALYQEYRI